MIKMSTYLNFTGPTIFKKYIIYLINILNDNCLYKKFHVIYYNMDKKKLNNSNILTRDILTFFFFLKSTFTYESIGF